MILVRRRYVKLIATVVRNSLSRRGGKIWFVIFVILLAVFGMTILSDMQWKNMEAHADASDKLPMPPQAPQDATWQSISGSNLEFYVYSAYVERRSEQVVRVIAAAKTQDPDQVFCRIWLPNNLTFTLHAKVKTIRENKNRRYSAIFVLCLLYGTSVKSEDTVGALITVIASSNLLHPPSNLLIVQDTEQRTGVEQSIHVCVKPFHHSFARDEWLVEWFEMNRLLGVEHFYMYHNNNSVSKSVGCLLEHYKKKNLVTLLSWKLPLPFEDIWIGGQLAAFNDCLYRSMSNAGWLLIIDVDELVLPRQNRTLSSLLPKARSVAAVIFRHAYFFPLWADDVKAPVPLLTARKTRRSAIPHVTKKRSKYAVRPRDMIELGNHYALESVKGGRSITVDPNIALLHHYRLTCDTDYGGMKCLTIPSIVDRTAHRWSEKLLRRVIAEKSEISNTCSFDSAIKR